VHKDVVAFSVFSLTNRLLEDKQLVSKTTHKPNVGNAKQSVSQNSGS